MANIIPIKATELRPLRDHIICEDIEVGERFTSGGIVLLNDDGKTTGIRSRWARVIAVGAEQKDVAVGKWVLVEHGRWTRAVTLELNGEEKTIVRIDPKGIMAIADEKPKNFETHAASHIMHG